MKIYFLFYLFFSSLDPFLSSPINKKDVDAYNKDVAKLESSMKAMMPKIDDYLSNMNLVLKKQEGKIEDKSLTTTKSIENKERIAEVYKNFSENNDKKSLENVTSDQRKDAFDEAKTNEEFIQLGRDSCHHIQTAVFNIIPKSKHEKLMKRGIEVHSDKMPMQISNNKNTSNEQAYNKESQKINSVQKDIPDNDNNNAISNAEALDQSTNKVITKLIQGNKGIFTNLSTDLINQNKSSVIDFNSGNEMLQIRNSENLGMQKFDRNAENAKNNKIDTANGTALTSKAEVTNPQENSNMANKTFSSTEEISVKYQKNVNSKVKLTLPTIVLVNQNEIDITSSGKSEIENPTKKEENSSMTSSADYDKEQENSPAKDTAETFEKIKFGENGQVATEKTIMNHSVSTGKLNDSGPKSKKITAKLNDSGAKSLKAGAKLNESGGIPLKTDAKLNVSGAKLLKAGAELNEPGAIPPKTDAKVNDSGAKLLKAGSKLNESGAIPPKTDAKLNVSGAKLLKAGAELNGSGEIPPKTDAKVNDSGAKFLKAGAKLNESGTIPPKIDSKLNDSGPKSKKVDAILNDSGSKLLKDEAKLNKSGVISPKADAKLNDSDAKSPKTDKKKPNEGFPTISYFN